jgi:hypothetical protein
MTQTRRVALLAVPMLVTLMVAGWFLAWAVDVSVPRRLYYQPIKRILRMAW